MRKTTRGPEIKCTYCIFELHPADRSNRNMSVKNVSRNVSDLLGSFVKVNDENDTVSHGSHPEQPSKMVSNSGQIGTEEVLINFDQAIRRVTTQLSLYRSFGVKDESEKCEEQLDATLRATLRHIDEVVGAVVNLQGSFRDSYPTDIRIQDLRLVAENIGDLRAAVMELSKTGTKKGIIQKEAEVADDLYKIAGSVQRLWRLYMNAKAEKFLMKKTLYEVEKQLDWGKDLAYYVSLPFLLPVWMVSKVMKQVFISASDYVDQFVKGRSPAYVNVNGSCNQSDDSASADMTSLPNGSEKDKLQSFEDSSGYVSEGVLYTSTPKRASRPPSFRTEVSGSYIEQPVFDEPRTDSGISTSFVTSRSRYSISRALNKSNEMFHLALKYGSRPITYKKNIIVGLAIYVFFLLVVFVYYAGFSLTGPPISSGQSNSIMNVLGAVLDRYTTLRRTGHVPI